MTRPYATLPEQLAGILTAQIVPAGFTARSRPNGTGPFQYKSFTAGQQSVFTRNPYYRQHGLPYAGTLTIIDFPDTTSLADALRTEQVHAAGTLTARRYLSCLPPAASMPSCPRRGPSPPSRRPQPSNSLSSSSVRLWSAYED